MILWAAVGAAASAPTVSEALTLVDRLGWAAEAPEIRRLLREAVRPDSVYAQSLREPDRAVAQTLDHPTLYAVEARLERIGSPAYAATLELREAIVYTNPSKTPLEELVLRVFPDAVGAVGLTGVWVDGRLVPAKIDDTSMRIFLPEPLGPGDRTRVLITLLQEVPPFDPAIGLHGDMLEPAETGAYGVAAGHIGLGYWLPLITPVDDAGTFDTRPIRPNTEHALFDPALFHVVLDVPSDLAVATTGVETLRRADGGRATVVAVASAAREFSVHLGEGLAELDTEVGGTRIRVHFPADEPALGRHLLEYAEGALRSCTAAFGPIAAAELDVVEAPTRIALGMEYPGLVTVDAHDRSGRYARSAIHEWTVAHEIAHQWWSAEVGSEPGDTPWLDEALASWSAALYWESRYGREALELRRRLDVVEPTMALRDRGSPDLPADLEAWRYDLHQYSAIVYGRAALFFDALAAELGRDAVLAGLARYHDEQRNRIATADDLLDALRAEAADDSVVDRLYERWIREAHGYEDLLD